MRQSALRTSDVLLKILPPLHTPRAWATAALGFAAATLLKAVLDNLAGGPLPPFITFYPAVVAAGLAAGPRAGVLAALLTVVLAWIIWLPPYGDIRLSDPVALTALVVYAVFAVFLGWFSGMARIALEDSRAAERTRDKAAQEAVHRVKNLIAIIDAIQVKVSRETSTTAEFSQMLGQRLRAMAAAQDVLLRRHWQDADLQSVIETCLQPFLSNSRLHFRGGPKAQVPASCVGGLCLALHELCTNSIKYGALSLSEGRVDLDWAIEAGAVELSWREEPGSANEVGSGFGTLLIRAALAGEPGTEVHYEIKPSHIHAAFRWRPPAD